MWSILEEPSVWVVSRAPGWVRREETVLGDRVREMPSVPVAAGLDLETSRRGPSV